MVVRPRTGYMVYDDWCKQQKFWSDCRSFHKRLSAQSVLRLKCQIDVPVVGEPNCTATYKGKILAHPARFTELTIIAMAFVKKRCNCTPASFCFQKTLIITPVWLHVPTSAFFSIFRSSGTYCSQVAVWSIIYWTPWAPAKRVQGGRPTLIVFLHLVLTHQNLRHIRITNFFPTGIVIVLWYQAMH